MPLVEIELLDGVFDDNQKREMIRKVTEAMVDVQGEAMRDKTWVRTKIIPSGHFAIGGDIMDPAGVRKPAAE
jgi:4-oxalocrotonate tautomerase